VQCGDRPRNEKPLHGDLSGISEFVADSRDGNTYRSVYTVTLDPFVYVLHCFEKKSKRGIGLTSPPCASKPHRKSAARKIMHAAGPEPRSGLFRLIRPLRESPQPQPEVGFTVPS
jgi:phage-related protein